MEINISTPALLFSAISLLMLAYTNRFLALAQLIRQYATMYREHPEDRVLKQIQNFDARLNIIKITQIFGVTSFLFCVLSMFLIFIKWITPAEILFAISLVALFASLLLSLKELFMSIGALNIELGEIVSEYRKQNTSKKLFWFDFFILISEWVFLANWVWSFKNIICLGVKSLLSKEVLGLEYFLKGLTGKTPKSNLTEKL